MFTGLETGFGLDVVLALQAMRNPVFDMLATVLNFMGDNLFYLPVLCFVYWSLNKRLGLRLLFALALSGAVVIGIKELLQLPRPFHVSDDVFTLGDLEGLGFGFPSGHVGMSIAIWGYAALWYRSRKMLLGVAILALLMAWGRMYSGLHYPQDVIAGAVVGIAVLWGYRRYSTPFIEFWRDLAVGARVASVVLVGIVTTVFLFTDQYGLAVSGVFWGAGLGVILERERVRFSAEGTVRQRVLRYVVGLVLILIVFFGLRILFSDAEPFQLFYILRYAIVAVFGVALWPWLSLRLGLSEPYRGSPVPVTP